MTALRRRSERSLVESERQNGVLIIFTTKPRLALYQIYTAIAKIKTYRERGFTSRDLSLINTFGKCL
jgi:hypothetical protein